MRCTRICAVLVAILTAPLAAQPLTLDEAIDRALLAEPSLAIASADHDAAAAARREAESLTSPQVTLSGSMVRHEERMLVSPIHGFDPTIIPEFDETLIQSALSGSWLLYDGGAASARVRQAESLTHSAAESIITAEQLVVARTVAAFLAVLAARESVAAEDRRLEAIDAEVRRVELLKKVGRAADLEVFRVEAARAAAEADRTAVAAQLELAEADLARMTDLPRDRTAAASLAGGNVAPLQPSIWSETAPEEIQASALDTNPRVRQARHRLLAQAAALESARASRHPQVNAAANLLEYASAAGDLTFEWNAGVNLRFSVFDSGGTSARIDRARAAENQARAQLAAMEDEVRQSLDRAWADLRQAEATVVSVRRAEERFAEIARIEALRLEAGVGTQTDYLRAVADLALSRAALARARQRLALAHVELARAAGQLDREWVAANLRSTE